jgi:hypothetical protein
MRDTSHFENDLKKKISAASRALPINATLRWFAAPMRVHGLARRYLGG